MSASHLYPGRPLVFTHALDVGLRREGRFVPRVRPSPPTSVSSRFLFPRSPEFLPPARKPGRRADRNADRATIHLLRRADELGGFHRCRLTGDADSASGSGALGAQTVIAPVRENLMTQMG